MAAAPKKRQRPRRRPWQRELREQLLVGLDDVRRRLRRIDLGPARKADIDALGDLVEDTERIAEAIAEVRCLECGCSHNDPCPEGCGWATHVPAICTRCYVPPARSVKRVRR